MNKTYIIIFLFILLCSFSHNQNQVNIRFKNGTNKDITTLNVNIVGKRFTFHNIKQGKQTEVIAVPKAYGYCYAQAITSTDTLVCQPQDFVGETLYTEGDFSMELFIISAERNMGIKLINLNKH